MAILKILSNEFTAWFNNDPPASTPYSSDVFDLNQWQSLARSAPDAPNDSLRWQDYWTIKPSEIRVDLPGIWMKWEGDFEIVGSKILRGNFTAIEGYRGESFGNFRISDISIPLKGNASAFWFLTIPYGLYTILTNNDDSATLEKLNALGAGSEYYFATPYDTQPITTAPSQEPQEASSQVLNGVVGQADLLTFSGQPAFGIGQADNITNFNPKEGDALSISLDEFIGSSRLPKLKIAKNKKGLQKILASKTEFVYDQSTGYLYFNENKALKGFGDGGVFAVLEGAPGIRPSDLSFM